MSGWYCKHCGKLVVTANRCGCPLERAEDQKLIDSIKAPPPVDRTNRCTTDGEPLCQTEDTNKPDGQHKNYVILCDDERAKGFVRPYRDKYIHNKCGVETRMGQKLSETYARDPSFYSHTFCCGCNAHLPVSEFRWSADNEEVGS